MLIQANRRISSLRTSDWLYVVRIFGMNCCTVCCHMTYITKGVDWKDIYFNRYFTHFLISPTPRTTRKETTPFRIVLLCETFPLAAVPQSDGTRGAKAKVQLPAKGRAYLKQFGSSTETHASSLHVYNSLGGCSNNGIQNRLEPTAVHYS